MREAILLATAVLILMIYIIGYTSGKIKTLKRGAELGVVEYCIPQKKLSFPEDCEK